MRKSFLRFLSVGIAALTACLALAGCHGSREAAPVFEVPQVFDESREYNITFWAKNDTNKAQTDI